jgi:hypothetical protein
VAGPVHSDSMATTWASLGPGQPKETSQSTARHGPGLGAFALPLFDGVALYVAGQLLFKRRMHNALSVPRLVATGVLLAALPAAVVAPPLAGLAGLVLILAALIVVEATRDAQVRRSLRGA